MHIALIDQISNNGNSFFHKASPIAKIVMTVLLLTSVIASRDILRLLAVISVVIILFIVSRLPIRDIWHLPLYPVFFSTVFALFEMQESFVAGLLIILRGVGSALVMVFLISTTSYIEIFGFLGLFLPKLMIDILIFTYRSFFILLDRVENLIKSIRLRGGFRKFGIFANIRSLAGMTAVLLLHSFEMGERMYRIYSLRGYDGNVPVQFKWKPVNKSDYIIVFLSGIVLLGVMI